VRPSSERTVRLPPGVALHARPAADFVRTAMRYGARVTVSSSGREADAKSLMAVLALGAGGGSELALRGEGDDALAAVEALAGCVAAFE
jgi:phosphocarrier protein HPr